jgi:glutamate N-acetyltransferase/amino-acid N-acetyltransferase
MNPELEAISNGTITSPQGFLAGAIGTGLKIKEALDLGMLYSQLPSIATGVFTSSKIKAAPLALSQRHLVDKKAQAIVANSGCANACTGEQGVLDAAEMTQLAAQKLGILPSDVLVASTGLIGTPLSMKHIRAGIEKIKLSHHGGHELAKAITTTDTFTKELAVALQLGGCEVTIGGIAKGSGMVHPNLATLLCFLTTDAAVDPDFLQQALQRAVSDSFNMISIDGDTSPNDTVFILANGLAGNQTLTPSSSESGKFEKALEEVCFYLAKCIAGDGEGATKLIEIKVEGAKTLADARVAARAVAASPLVKAAVHGSNPNWGRIIAALGRSGAEVVESSIDLYLDNLCLVKGGCPSPFNRGEGRSLLSRAEVPIKVCLNLGNGVATAWGCDLSEEYVTINSTYTT